MKPIVNINKGNFTLKKELRIEFKLFLDKNITNKLKMSIAAISQPRL